MTDLNNNKRRFIISSFNKEYKNTALHVMLPFTAVKRGVWLNLCLDLVSLISDCFKGQSFRSLDTIILSGVFRLRKIFSMKCQPPDTTGEYGMDNLADDVFVAHSPHNFFIQISPILYLGETLKLSRDLFNSHLVSNISPKY